MADGAISDVCAGVPSPIFLSSHISLNGHSAFTEPAEIAPREFGEANPSAVRSSSSSSPVFLIYSCENSSDMNLRKGNHDSDRCTRLRLLGSKYRQELALVGIGAGRLRVR